MAGRAEVSGLVGLKLGERETDGTFQQGDDVRDGQGVLPERDGEVGECGREMVGADRSEVGLAAGCSVVASVLEPLELGEGQFELAGEMLLVADGVLKAGCLGEDALAAKLPNLALDGAIGDASAVVVGSGGGDGGGDEVVGSAPGRLGDGVDADEDTGYGPAGEVGEAIVAADDAGQVDAIEVDGVDLLLDGGDDVLGVFACERGIRRALTEAVERAKTSTDADEGGADLLDTAGLVLVDDVGLGIGLGVGGDVALVAGDAAQPPEDEGDALGEGFLEVVGRGEAFQGAGAVVFPVGGGLEAGDDGGGGAEAVADGVEAAGGELGLGGHEGALLYWSTRDGRQRERQRGTGRAASY